MADAAEAEEDVVESAAKRAYYANWRELPGGRFPPPWENAGDAVRDWVRRMAAAALDPSAAASPPMKRN